MPRSSCFRAATSLGSSAAPPVSAAGSLLQPRKLPRISIGSAARGELSPRTSTALCSKLAQVPPIPQRSGTLVALLALIFLTACRKGAFPDVPPGYREFAYVANTAANSVSVLDLVYLRSDRTLRVGDAPVALAVNPVRPEIYVVNRNSNSVSVINATTNAIDATIAVRRSPTAIAISSDGRRAFVSNSAAGSVSLLDLVARRELTSIATPAAPSDLHLAPDDRTLAVTSRGTGLVFLFDVTPITPSSGRRPLELRATLSGCPGAADPVVLPDSSKLFVACSSSHQVMAVSLAAAPGSWAARQNSSLLADHFLTFLEVGQHPDHLALKPDGGEIFVSNSASDSISEIATQTNEVGGTYTVVSSPGHAVVSADNGSLWVANVAADSLALYSIDDGRLVSNVRTGSAPDALAFSADQHLLLAANTRSGDVAVIRTVGQVGPALFTMLPAGSSPSAIVTRSFTERR